MEFVGILAARRRNPTPIGVASARSLLTIPLLAVTLGAAGCGRTEPFLRLAVAENLETTDVESGSTLVVRGEGFPLGTPAELVFTGERRSYLHPGPIELRLPARAAAHDRVELPLDDVATCAILGEGDDDARLRGDLEVRFHTTGAVVVTKPVPVEFRMRAFPRNARVAAEKRARIAELLRSLGLQIAPDLTVEKRVSCTLCRGDVAGGDKLRSINGVPLQSLDDAMPPDGFAFANLTRVETVSADGVEHQLRGLTGLRYLLFGTLAAAVLLAFSLEIRRITRTSLPPTLTAHRAPPSREILLATGLGALGFELGLRALRLHVDAPTVLTLVAVALFGPSRRSLGLGLAMGLASSAALVSGGVFRMDELHGALGPMAMAGLGLSLCIWAQRFAGLAPSRTASMALLLVVLPALHVVAPRVGMTAACGRAVAATALAGVVSPILQRGLAPIREGLSGAALGAAIAAAASSLGAAIALGPVGGASVATVAAVGLACAAFFPPFARREKWQG